MGEKKHASTGITEMVFVIDASGSMHGLEDDTIGGINSVLEENRALDGRANVSLVQFNNVSRVIINRRDIHKVKNLGRRDYRVGGCTALLDAMGDAISHTRMVQKILPAEYRAEHVMFVVVTDGLENASRKYSRTQVRQLVKKCQKKGWEFIFLGANIDSVAEAGALGIDAAHAADYLPDALGNQAAYRAVGSATVSIRSCGSLPDTWAEEARADTRRRG